MARFDKYFIFFLYYYSNYYEGTIWYSMCYRRMDALHGYMFVHLYLLYYKI